MSELLEARIVKPGAMSKAGLRKVALDLLRERDLLRSELDAIWDLVDEHGTEVFTAETLEALFPLSRTPWE